jgi:leucyl-tRNA synthetase
MLAPFAPFAAEELWRVDLGEASSVHRSAWPSFDPSLVVEDTVTLVVQVNGKVRDKLEVPADISEVDALAAARASAGAQRAIADREVVKEIVRAPKLVNLVVKG